MKNVYVQELQVHESLHADTFSDMARIHHSKRGAIKAGSVVKLSANGTCWWFAVRGLKVDKEKPDQENWVRIDDYARERLGDLKVGTTYQFRIELASIWGQIRWAMGSSNPATRVATGLAIYSAILGIILSLVI